MRIRLAPHRRTLVIMVSLLGFTLEMNQLQLSHRFIRESEWLRSSDDIAVAPVTQHTHRNVTDPSRVSNSDNAAAPAYSIDELCGRCRTIPVRQHTCGSLIYQTASEKNISLAEAAKIEVEQSKHTQCQPCLPEFCEEPAKKIWRYDQLAPPVQQAQTHYLSSIPSEHRVPAEHLPTLFDKDYSFEAVTAFFSDPTNAYPNRRYLFDYNPSLVVIPKQQIPEIEGEAPVYLASYRVSTQQSCFPANTTLVMIGGSWDKKPKKMDYLALALLRSDLSIIQNVVLDIPKEFGRREDFRLFSIHGQIYIASFCQIAPLWINDAYTNGPGGVSGTTVVKQKFPSPLQITMRLKPTFCSQERGDLLSAKSLNFFVDQNNKTVVEMQPDGPHIVHEVDLSSTNRSEAPFKANATTDKQKPEPSFYTREQADLANNRNFFGYPFTTDRGGACCIPFQDPTNPTNNLLLAVGHVKTPHGRKKLEGIVNKNHYLSLFYAIEASPPYRVVARSGFFCLPAHPDTTNSSSLDRNPLAKIPVFNPLDIAGTTYDSCAAIHFVTGMTEKADDPNKLILAYGIADCSAWFAEVNKADVLAKLFPLSPRKEDAVKQSS